MRKPTKWRLDPLPIKFDLEIKSVLKKLPRAHAALAELKGIRSSQQPIQTPLFKNRICGQRSRRK